MTCLYIALTRDSAKRIMFKDVMNAINTKHSLGMEFNHSDLTVKFPNGSLIYFMGMDSSDQESQKVLGQKFKLVIIDEAASFRRDLKELVYKVLRPACADLNGQIAMIGTPSNYAKGLFYDVVTGSETGWKIHKWTAFDNPYMREAWEREIEDLKKENPNVVDLPWFKQMYLGEYVIDDSKLVYKFSKTFNMVSETPKYMNHVIGVDLGFNDDTAFSVLGYRDDDRTAYIVDVYKKPKMLLSDVGERLMYLWRKYEPLAIVVDNASKQSVEELRMRFGLPLTPAEKVGKSEFIEIMNSEFMLGHIKAHKRCDPLFVEYAHLVWDEHPLKRIEHPGCANHLADATLYAWRYCYNYLFHEIEKKKLTDQEKVDLWFEKKSAIVERRKKPTIFDHEELDLYEEMSEDGYQGN